MEQYKIINAELMSQVQNQRIVIGKMLEKEVLLQKQWMEERERRLADEQHNEFKIKCAVKTLIRSLDLNLDISMDHASLHSSQSSEQARRNPSEICSEFRRSSALLQKPRTMSPRKSRSGSFSSVVILNDEEKETTNKTPSRLEEAEEIDTRTPEPRRLAELQEYMSSPDSPQLEPTDDQPVISHSPAGADYMSSIIEEEDSQEEITLSSSTDLESTEKRLSRDDILVLSLPLRDVTNKSAANLLASTRDSSTEKLSISHVRSGRKQSSPDRLPKQRSSPKITQTRGHLMRNPVTVVDCDTHEPSIQLVRRASRHSSPVQLAVPCSSAAAWMQVTPGRNQLDFSSFNGIAYRPGDSSTPRPIEDNLNNVKKAVSTKVKSKRTKSIASSTITTELSSIDGALNGRPSRTCRPKSLKEPNTKTKLRNETSAKL